MEEKDDLVGDENARAEKTLLAILDCRTSFFRVGIANCPLSPLTLEFNYWGTNMIEGKDNGKCSHRSLSTMLASLSCILLFALAACGTNTPTEGAATPAHTATSSRAAPLTLKFWCNDNPGGGFFVIASRARVCVQTAPGAALTITVKFCNGTPDPSSELRGTVNADSRGYYEWNWPPRTDCKGFIWRGEADVTARLNGQSTSGATSFFGDSA